MEEGLTRRSPLGYISRRLQRVFVPWLTWFSLIFALTLTVGIVQGRLGIHASQSSARLVGHTLYSCLFYSAYWFVPNLLIALGVLLACRRFLFDIRLGCLLLAPSLFYGLNIHAHWIPIENHTEALFGFIFYLWLGAWTARNFTSVQAWIERTSMMWLLTLAALTGLAALEESFLLDAANAPLPLNVLRISNQAYSVAFVLVLFKLRRPIWPRAMNVRATMFGIYLTHPFTMWVLISIIRRKILNEIAGLTGIAHTATVLFFLLGYFAATYGCSLALTQWLLKDKFLRWTVGDFTSVRPTQGEGEPS